MQFSFHFHRLLIVFFASILIISCNSQHAVEEVDVLSNDAILTQVQQQTFNYFWDGAEPNSGLALERFHTDEPEVDADIVTTGGSGFGLMAMIVGVERGFITRNQFLDRMDTIITFLESADRFHGVWPHWLSGSTGKVVPFSPKDNGGDLVESSFLAAGLITVRQYLNAEDPREQSLQGRINTLWEAMEFDFYTNGENVLYWHWSPEFAWDMNFPIGGYNECLITYVMAAASPTHSITSEVYEQGWARNDSITQDTTYLGYRTILDHYEYGDAPVGPLFWAHYSYLGLDPRNLKDKYADYWDLNVNHARIHHAYAIENPMDFSGYSDSLWGLTSSYSINFYAGHRPGEDLGVISPTAALSSIPYTPEESLKFINFLYNPSRDSLIGVYGPYDAFSVEHAWMVPRYLAIDQGPIPVMIENYRTGLIWDLFMSAEEIQQGLTKLGFTYE